MMKRTKPVIIILVFLLSVSISGCGSRSALTKHPSPVRQTQTAASGSGGTAVEQPVAPEKNPPGDIPDSQVFVRYVSPSGYELETPEGWARSLEGSDVTFRNKLDGVKVALTSEAAPPSVKSVRDNQAQLLKKSGRAVQIRCVQETQLPGGKAVLLVYDANSDPDPVTGKRVRLEENGYLFYKNGKLATLTLWAPLGADNVDQWKRIAGSFRWR